MTLFCRVDHTGCSAGCDGKSAVSGCAIDADFKQAVGVHLDRSLVAVAAADDLGEEDPDPGQEMIRGLLHSQDRGRNIAVIHPAALAAARLERQCPAG